MSVYEERCARFLAEGGLCSLHVDDELPADRTSLETFLGSSVRGVVIPTIASSTARLVCGEYVIYGNQQIRDFIRTVESRNAAAKK